MNDLAFFTVGILLAIVTAAVGRTVVQGPQYKVEKAMTKWLLNCVLLVILLALIGGLAMLRQSMKGPPTVFDVLEGESELPPTT